MKRNLSALCLLLLFGCSHSLLAQKGPQIGVFGGPQSTWMFNQDDSDEGDQLDYQPTYGSQMGVRAGFFFSDKVGLEAGFFRSSQGQKYKHVFEFGGNEEEYESERSLTYNKIPILLHLRSQPDEAAYFSVVVGPQFSMLSGMSSSNDFPSGFGLQANSWGDESDYEEMTTDIVLGFGPGFSLTDFLKLDLHFRFDYSFTDAENKSEGWSDDRPITNNVTGALQLGLVYGFGG